MHFLSTGSSPSNFPATSSLEVVIHVVHTAYDNDESSIHPFPPHA